MSGFAVSDRIRPYQNVFAFLILLTGLISLVVFPPHSLVALLTYYVPDDMPARRHVSFHCLTLPLIDH